MADQKRSLTDAVVTDAAVRRSRWSEDLAGVAVLELDDLVVDLNVTDSRWGSLPCGDVPICSLCGDKNITFISRCWQINTSVFSQIINIITFTNSHSLQCYCTGLH